MSWQDIVIALCQLAFLPSILPTIFGNDKPALSTSIMNTIIVATITITMATMQLWFSVVAGHYYGINVGNPSYSEMQTKDKLSVV